MAKRKQAKNPPPPHQAAVPQAKARRATTRAEQQESFTPLSHDTLDRVSRALVARMTGGLSPTAIATAWMDWLTHFSRAPGKQLKLSEKAVRDATALLAHAIETVTGKAPAPLIDPLPGDHRFDDEDWQSPPASVLVQAFLLSEDWWFEAASNVRGMTAKHGDQVHFMVKQMLDLFAPSNIPWLNPEIRRRTMEEGGQNLVRGFQNWMDDSFRIMTGQAPVEGDGHHPGENLAITPGKVVYRNHLMELIQYAPATDTVHAEPVLFVPAWIMKYYILDLSPENSLVKWLVERGHTVFMISWRNPTAEDRDLSLEDYRLQGVMAALDAVSAIVPDQKIQSVGYCLGGTLLALAAAKMAQDNDDRLASMTLFAGQTDFSEAGELLLFIDEGQLAVLEDMMWDQGYLDTTQMSGAFQILRTNELVWSRIIRDYVLGERPKSSDLMAWNADRTRMPFRMHSQYLRALFLENRFSRGRFAIEGKTVAPRDIRVPIFALGTERDHIAPWTSVYKIALIADTEVTFVLSGGGHNSAIVNPPNGHPNAHYRHMTMGEDDNYIDPESWAKQAPCTKGSWWPEWEKWLSSKGSGKMVAAREPGNPDNGYPPREEAPGTYIFQT